MTLQREIPDRSAIDLAAENGGIAVAIVDRKGNELFAANNNSICRVLNPGGTLVKECSAFCGMALEESLELGGHASFTCHAGLECMASAVVLDNEPVAMIVGRTFVSTDKYRDATQRSISGNWQDHDPIELFENVLMTPSPNEIEMTLDRLEAGAELTTSPYQLVPDETAAPPSGSTDIEAEPNQILDLGPIDRDLSSAAGILPKTPAGRVSDTGAFRSFFSSILDKDYRSACSSFLDLIGEHYSFDSLAWLERRERRLVKIAAVGALKKRRINLGIPPDDERLAISANDGSPIQLIERVNDPTADSRTLSLFAVPVGSEIPAALAVLDEVADPAIGRQIARLCRSVGPKLEILRLRGEMFRKDSLAEAGKRFSEGLKNVDTADFWLQMTQIAAELMQAERGSLMVLDESTGSLTIKAAVGMRIDPDDEPIPGSRVARIILERGKPAVVTDVERTGLPSVAGERGYKTTSFLSSPILLEGRGIAVINFTDKASGAEFSKSDLEMLEGIVPQIAVAIDRATLKERAGEFQTLSVTDPLTGLLNRRYMDERMTEEVKRSNRHGYPMSFVMLDVDHFKSYNDEFGHPAGDEALKLVGEVIRDTLRGADVAARYGGEEFAILLPQTTSEEAAVISERLRSNVESKHFPHSQITVSIGVASCTSELCHQESLMNAADKALYDAKRSGRNRVETYGYLDGEERNV